LRLYPTPSCAACPGHALPRCALLRAAAAAAAAGCWDRRQRRERAAAGGRPGRPGWRGGKWLSEHPDLHVQAALGVVLRLAAHRSGSGTRRQLLQQFQRREFDSRGPVRGGSSGGNAGQVCPQTGEKGGIRLWNPDLRGQGRLVYTTRPAPDRSPSELPVAWRYTTPWKGDRLSSCSSPDLLVRCMRREERCGLYVC
jgi:hypothetical protein